MNWYKKAKQKEWSSFLNDLHKKRDRIRNKATSLGAKLGHILEPWGPMDSCYRRKCGAYAKINGILADHDGKTFYGAAFINPCNVNFNTPPNFTKFENPNPKHSVI